MRKVQVSESSWGPGAGGIPVFAKRPAYAALFHQFAQGSDENGFPMPVAIVEDGDGFVHSVHAEMIQFIPNEQANDAVQVVTL